MSIRKPTAEVQKPTEFQITSEDAVKILKTIASQNPDYFHQVYTFVKQDTENKRRLLQLQQNLNADLNSVVSELASIDKTLKELNGKRGWLIRRKFELKNQLDAVHVEWIQRYSASGNASL